MRVIARYIAPCGPCRGLIGGGRDLGLGDEILVFEERAQGFRYEILVVVERAQDFRYGILVVVERAHGFRYGYPILATPAPDYRYGNLIFVPHDLVFRYGNLVPGLRIAHVIRQILGGAIYGAAFSTEKMISRPARL